jgi:hypothetical protein
MPLVPLIGAEPVVPIIAIASIFTNFGRAVAYFRYADRRRALIVIAAAALTTALGAFGYTRLSNAGAAMVTASCCSSRWAEVGFRKALPPGDRSPAARP